MAASRSKQYLETNRPWLSLYGMRVRPIRNTSDQLVQDSALLHRILPDELLHEVFARMSSYTLGRAACVCRKWNFALRNPELWRATCLKTWQMTGTRMNEIIVQQSYGGSWRRMWVQRPRLRFDGLYVSRNTYVKPGVTEWRNRSPAHLVCYYRYLRFFPGGKFLYKNSPGLVKEVAKVMQGRPSKIDAVFSGQFTLTSNTVDAAVLYPGKPTMLRFRLSVRGTVPGANNRLDLLRITTTGAGGDVDQENVLDSVDDWQDDETHDPDIPAISHRRGLSPCVFVPFDEVETSILNLPVDKMDYYVPG